MSQLSYSNLVDGDTPTASGFNTRFLLAINLLNSGIEADNIASLAVTTAKIASKAVTLAKMEDGTQGDILYYGASGVIARLTAGTSGQWLKTQGAGANPTWADLSVTSSNLPSGSQIQSVTSSTGSVATGTTIIPDDDTVPQNTEGDEYLSLAITPNNTNNILEIEVVIAAITNGGGSGVMTLALFQDSTANALQCVQQTFSAAGLRQNMVLRYKMTAGTTSATTFKVRVGADVAGTTTLNGVGGARKLGGVLASSINIKEIKA